VNKKQQKTLKKIFAKPTRADIAWNEVKSLLAACNADISEGRGGVKIMMKNILKYKEYTGSVNFDADDRIFHGRVLGIRDVIGFEGESVTDLEKDFREAIEDYLETLETCREISKEPEKPFSGRFVVRIPSELHCAIALEAKKQKKSINSWIADTFKSAIEVH